MFLSWVAPRSRTGHSSRDLTCRHASSETHAAGFGDALEPGGDVDAVPRQIAVGFLDHVANVDADAEFDAFLRGQAGVTLDETALAFNRAAHRFDRAAKLDDAAVSGAPDDAPDGRLSRGR